MKKKQGENTMKKTILIVIALLFNISFTSAGTVSDRDGNKYKTVKIGNLEWMTDDLKFELETSKCLEKNANPDDCVRIYWGVINDNWCPDGWRLPLDADIADISRSYLPNDYEQMTAKNKRHIFSDAQHKFKEFFNSINWPETDPKSGIYNFYFYKWDMFGRPMAGIFYVPSENYISDNCPCKYGFFEGEPMIQKGAAAKIRCVKNLAVKKQEKAKETKTYYDDEPKPIQIPMKKF